MRQPSNDLGEPTAAWGRTSASCGECSTVFDGCSCPNCGERSDASRLEAFGFVTVRAEGPWLTVIGSNGSGWATTSSRPLTEEQAAWLRRQGDVR